MSVKYRAARAVAAGLVALIAISAGCSSSDGPEPFDPAKQIQRAWGYFAAEDYGKAVNVFDDVLSHSADSAEPLMGKGWCLAFQREYSEAIASFEVANSEGLPTADAWMGLTVVYRDFPDYSAGLISGREVIEIDSFYVFSKRTTIDYKDAHLIMAQCAYRLGRSEFATAHEEINYLCNLEGLPPLPDPGSVSGEEYEMQMVEKLEALHDLIGD